MAHVDPDIAIAAMTRLWRNFGNEVSSPLVRSWRIMCEALNAAGQPKSVGWTALAMPTGIGKTQFAALYCALIPNPQITLNNLKLGDLHPGVLFVTRFTEEANRFVEQVNQHAGRKVAAAYHSDASTTLADATRFPILAITHRACELYQSEDTIATDEGTIWEHLTGWLQSRRAKIIIDETPNFAACVQLNSNWLAQTLGALKYLTDANRTQYSALESLLASITHPETTNRSRRLRTDEIEDIHEIDTRRMREALSAADNYALAVECGPTKTSLRAVVQKTLSAIEAIQSNGWAWISYRNKIAQLNSATLHPSLRDGSGIILDATAAVYPGYGLLSPPANVIAAPANVRNYDNVKLYVARGHKAGKGYMADHVEKLWPQYREAIEAALPNAERILVCLHKIAREKVDVTALPRVSLAHYGEIDGRNDWDTHEAVALLGLPYLDGATPANIAQALLGAQTTEWLQTPATRHTKEYDDVLATLHRGHMAASAIQAIHRVRMRRAIDSAGRCKPTSVFLLLPNGTDGDAVLSAVVSSLPGARMIGWQVEFAKRKKRTVPTTEALLELFTNARPDVYTKAQVQSASGISSASLDRFIKRIQCPSSAERLNLDALGVSYYPQRGQGAEAYFVKA